MKKKKKWVLFIRLYLKREGEIKEEEEVYEVIRVLFTGAKIFTNYSLSLIFN
jgi:hypothetical protein